MLTKKCPPCPWVEKDGTEEEGIFVVDWRAVTPHGPKKTPPQTLTTQLDDLCHFHLSSFGYYKPDNRGIQQMANSYIFIFILIFILT